LWDAESGLMGPQSLPRHGTVRANLDDRHGEYHEMVSVTEKAVFAAGCFWGVEAKFSKVPGVISTTVGYTGGRTATPTYRDVCTDTTGHAEAVLVEYDSSRVTYEELLEVFWEMHDPTLSNRQGPDVGSQYRSAIFYTSPEQRDAAISSKERLEVTRRYGERRIVTEIVPLDRFFPAEDYHQKYHEKRGVCGSMTCRPR